MAQRGAFGVDRVLVENHVGGIDQGSDRINRRRGQRGLNVGDDHFLVRKDHIFFGAEAAEESRTRNSRGRS